ncbi:MAG: type II toxin-antitoxin system VapC family toxin [Beutenbergiaceae bacterium]
MSIIVDTSVVVGAFERKDPAAIDALKASGGPSIRSMFVHAELLSGIERATPATVAVRRRTYAAYLTITSAEDAPPAPTDLAKQFALMTALAARQGIRIGQNDRWILAEAITRGAGVLTADQRMHNMGTHATASFDIPGLTVLVDLAT